MASAWINRISSYQLFAVANDRQFYTLGTTNNKPGAIQANQNMQPNAQERRMMRRFDMRLPAMVRLEGSSEIQTETQNVSARGVFFYLDRAVSAGTRLEVTLTFPPHVTLTDAVRVRFSAHVIRVENPLPSARIGIAALIENYEFLRSNGSPDLMSALQAEWKSTN